MSGTLTAMMNATLRVLIVEDDQRYRGMLTTMLRDLACEPTPVASAGEALQWLHAQTTDLILLDLNLPRMDGLTFLTQLRQRDHATSVIILTGVGTLPAAQTAIRLGVTEFLTKPCHMGVMEAALDRVRRNLAQQRPPLPVVGVDSDEGSKKRTPPTTSIAAQSKHDKTASATLAELEREAILAALRSNGGNRSAAALALGISRRTMHYRLAEYRQAGLLDASLLLHDGPDSAPSPPETIERPRDGN